MEVEVEGGSLMSRGCRWRLRGCSLGLINGGGRGLGGGGGD